MGVKHRGLRVVASADVLATFLDSESGIGAPHGLAGAEQIRGVLSALAMPNRISAVGCYWMCNMGH